jgi:glycosyltransferase involved in cell wall biosynthesis
LKERAIHCVHRRSVSRFIAISGSVAESYLERGIVRQPDLDIVYNGLDYTDLPADMGGHRGKDDFTVCFAGRIVAEKGIMDFLALAERLRDEPGISFVVAGTGAELLQAKARAAAVGLGERIRFLGLVADMSTVWPSVSLFMMLSEKEPFGLVILEAIANGAAVLGYDAPSGGQEIMAHIPGCHMVARGSIEDLARALLDLKRNRAVAMRDVEAGQQVIRERFSLDCMEAGVAVAYGKLDAATLRKSFH